jgi:hypothetical protein
MKNIFTQIQVLAYCIIFFGVWVGLALFPPTGGYIWEPWTINITTSVLFTLLVYLTARLARTDSTIIGKVYRGNILVKLGVHDKWYSVDYKGNTGYVHGDYVTLLQDGDGSTSANTSTTTTTTTTTKKAWNGRYGWRYETTK